MMGEWPSLIWLLVPAFPVALAGIVFCSKSAAPILRNWLWLATVPALIAAVWVPESLTFTSLWPQASWGAQDTVARTFLVFTALLWLAAGVFASGSVRDKHQPRFWVFWLLSLSGNLLLVVAEDGISFYTGFSLMSLSAYGLVVHEGGPRPRRAGRLYLQMAVTGEFLVFAGLVLRTHAAGGDLAFADWTQVPLDPWTLALLVAGFGVKIGFWPLHVWLPLAHPAAPAAASAVLSGAMLKAGILGLWRFLPETDPLLSQWSGWLFGLGLFTAFYGVVLGLIAQKAKEALAYSSVSQMGYFLIILALVWRHPEQVTELTALLAAFMAHHALAKGALFMAAGVVGAPQLSKGKLRWLFWAILALPAFSLAGLPLTSGAAAKSFLKDVQYQSDFSHLSIVMSLASAGTMALLLRALLLLWRKQRETLHSCNKQMLVPWVFTSLASITVPWLWPPMREWLLYSLAPDHGLALMWPIMMSLAVAAIILWRHWGLPPALFHWRNPALEGSLRLKHLIQRPPLPTLQLPLSRRRWRQRERRWNHFWQNGTVMLSAWLVALLLLLGWLW